mmetsp:Transcript_9498/g.13462  ORF Transcript_9498/g.13462 Transcript_9498/m.13462 type:complete len:224 (+) Transcript_9498:40-711(+)
MTSDHDKIIVHVAVGTKNPCKIESVRTAFEKAFALTSSLKEIEIKISSHNVKSGVRDQPFGDKETKIGACNRAKSSYDLACVESQENNTQRPDFGVGLEGGIEVDEEKKMWCMAFMAVYGDLSNENCTLCKAIDSTFKPPSTRKLHWGISKTSSFLLPQKIQDLVSEGKELGTADDIIFKRHNSKQGSGTVGILSRNMINRSDYYDHALKLALVPFIWPEHYL